jgi:hypothetical protein
VWLRISLTSEDSVGTMVPIQITQKLKNSAFWCLNTTARWKFDQREARTTNCIHIEQKRSKLLLNCSYLFYCILLSRKVTRLPMNPDIKSDTGGSSPVKSVSKSSTGSFEVRLDKTNSPAPIFHDQIASQSSTAERILHSSLFFHWNTVLALFMMILLIIKDAGTHVINGSSALWNYSSVFFAIAMTLEMLLVIKVYGWWNHSKAYIRTHYLDVIVLLSMASEAIINAAEMETYISLTGFRCFRVLKGLQSVAFLNEVQSIFDSLKRARDIMLNIALALSFISVYVCILTYQLFAGIYDESCRNRKNDLFMKPVIYCDSIDNSTCPTGFYCSKTETLPSGGLENWDNAFFVFVSSFALYSTSDGWSRNQILPTWQKIPTWRYWTSIYFYFQVIIVSFIVINLFVAAISSTLQAARKNLMEDQQEEDAVNKDDVATSSIRQLASDSGNPSLMLKHTKNQINNHLLQILDKRNGKDDHRERQIRITVNAFKRHPVAKNQVVPVRGLTQKHLPPSTLQYTRLDQKIQYFRFQIIKLVNDRKFEFSVAVLVCLNTLTLASFQRNMSDFHAATLINLEIFFTFIFISEMFLKWFAFGLKKYFADRTNAFDATVIVFSLADFILSIMNFDIPNISVLRMFRLLRFVRALKRIKKLWQLFQVVIKSVKGLVNLMVFVMCSMCCMAIIGKEFLGGSSFYEGTEPVRFSWDTFPQALLLLFQILTADGWTITMHRYMSIRHDSNSPGDTAYELDMAVAAFVYHIICYILTNYILLNLLIVVVLENFEISDDDRQKEFLALLAENDESVKVALSSQKNDLLHFIDQIASWIATKKKCEADEVERATSASGLEAFIPSNKKNIKRKSIVGGRNRQVIAACSSLSQDESKALGYDAIEARKTAGDMSPKITDSGQSVLTKLGGTDESSKESSTVVKSTSSTSVDEQARKSWANHFLDSRDSMTERAKVWVQKFRCVYIKKSQKIASSNAFPVTVYSVILLSSFQLALQTPTSQPNFLDSSPYVYIDYLFWAVFIFEFSVLVSLGWCTYFANPWNLADFFILLATSVEMLLTASGVSNKGSFLRIIRLIRCVRPLRLLNKNESIRAVINAVAESLPSVFYVVLLYFFLTLTFAILGMQLFMAKFDICTDDAAVGFSDCFGVVLFQDDVSGLDLVLMKPRSWFVPTTNFDDAASAITTLFRITTLQWTSVYYQIIDSVGEDLNHIDGYNANSGSGFFILAYIFFSSFFIMNLFVAVIIEYFTTCTGSKLLTPSQKAWVRTRRYLSSLNFGMVPKPKGFRGAVYTFVNHRFFEWLILSAIVLNGLLMLVQHKGQSWIFDELMDWFNTMILSLFLLEMLAKLLAFELSGYLSDSWNKFDGFLVIFSVFMYFFAGEFQFAGQITRLFRLLRLIKLIKKATSLKSLLEALYISLPALANICLLVLLIMWIFAVIGVAQFGDLKEGIALSTQASACSFQGFVPSIITLFNLITGENWDTIMDEASIEYPYCTKSNPNVFPEVFGDCGSSAWSKVYFILFYISVFFIMVNLFIAVVVENVSFCYEDIEGFISDEDITHFGNVFNFHSTATVRLIGQKGFKTFAEYMNSYKTSGEVPPMPNPNTAIHKSALMCILHDLQDDKNGLKLQLGARMNPLSGHLLRLIGRRHYLAVWHEIDTLCKQRQDAEKLRKWEIVKKWFLEYYVKAVSKLTDAISEMRKLCQRRNRVSIDPMWFSVPKNRRFRAAAKLLMSNIALRERVSAIPMEAPERSFSNVAQLDHIAWPSIHVTKNLKIRDVESLTFAQLFLVLIKWAIPFDHLTMVEQLERKQDILIGNQNAAVALFVASFRGHKFRKLKRMNLQQAKGNMMKAARKLVANQSAARLNARMSGHMKKSEDDFEEIDVERRISNKVAAPTELQEQTVRFERMASRMKLDMQSSSKKCAQVSA